MRSSVAMIHICGSGGRELGVMLLQTVPFHHVHCRSQPRQDTKLNHLFVDIACASVGVLESDAVR